MGGHSDDIDSSAVFNVAIATIFAREFLEGFIIIANYRTVIKKNEQWGEDTKKKALREVTISASIAAFVAILVVMAVAIPLGIKSQDLNEKTVEIIEGVSKIVASLCILQLSVKIGCWLGIYWKVSIFPWKNKNWHKKEVEVLSFNEIRFNVAWNIWREVAECGVFLIPFFLGTGAKAIPVSALVGTGISLVLGLIMYWGNNRLESKFWLFFFMSGIMFWLAVGLFTGGLHEFEEVYGMTGNVWTIENPNMDSSKFPMVIFKPFGYSSSRSVLQISAFWSAIFVGGLYHYLKYRATQVVKASYVEPEPEIQKDVENGEPTQEVAKSDESDSADQESAEQEA